MTTTRSHVDDTITLSSIFKLTYKLTTIVIVVVVEMMIATIRMMLLMIVMMMLMIVIGRWRGLLDERSARLGVASSGQLGRVRGRAHHRGRCWPRRCGRARSRGVLRVDVNDRLVGRGRETTHTRNRNLEIECSYGGRMRVHALSAM